MAGIDKTYVSSYEDWKSIIDWCKENEFTCPNGIVLKPINSCYNIDLTKEEVEDWLKEQEEIPVMNTSCSMDYFLIKHCPIKVVQDRMLEVYDEDYVNAIKNGTSEFDTFTYPEPGHHFKLIKKPKWNYIYKWFNNYFHKYVKRGYHVQISTPEEYNYMWYNEEYDRWIYPYELGDDGCGNTAETDCLSIKSLLRKIKKWNLPVGTKVHFYGRYTGESGTILIKK